MIVELVRFRVHRGMTRAEVLADARTTLERWTGFPGLVSKTYTLAEDGTAVGIYLWESRAHAEAGHDAAWLQRAEAHWGNRPEISYHDALMTLDNRSGDVTEYPDR